MDYPLVSAIMLAGRHSHAELDFAIKCFNFQTYPNKELIVVNSHNIPISIDGVNVVNTGAAMPAGMARNIGLAAAHGKLFAQFDANCWHAPNRLEAQIATMAENDAQVSLLASSLSYSFVSGRALYQQNSRQAIVGSLVFVRPFQIEYAPYDKQEEIGLLEKMQKAKMTIITVPLPSLMCRLYYSDTPTPPTNQGMAENDFALIKSIVEDYRIS